MKGNESGRLVVANGNVVFPDGVRQTDVLAEDGVIVGIGPGLAEGARRFGSAVVEAEGSWVLPGLVDIHCDAIEKEIEPRPGTLFPMEMAFLQFERKLAGHGITTMLHSLSLGVGLSLRGEHLVSQVIALIRDIAEERSMIRHGVHLRYEVSHLAGLPLARKLASEGAIDYLSLMDHAPGIGQYAKPGAFEKYVMKNQGVTLAEVKAIVEELEERRAQVDGEKLRKLTALAHGRGIAVASHDDDSEEAVRRSLHYGAQVSEFPLNAATAAYAKGLGMGVCVGAPNIVRGGSHDGNLRAADAVKAGHADLICSDYHPASLLHAVFALSREGVPLAKAARMATIGPAEAIGWGGKIGSIALGKRADLIVVEEVRNCPVVRQTIVDGTIVFEAQPFNS